MAETAHIAEIADKLSKELFAEFLWRRVGPTNQNWNCEDTGRHGVTTHPSDVVFAYDEPELGLCREGLFEAILQHGHGYGIPDGNSPYSSARFASSYVDVDEFPQESDVPSRQ